MISKIAMIKILRRYYNEKKFGTCPFGKQVHNNMCDIPCRALCGQFPQLGDVKRGCPCDVLGQNKAVKALATIIKGV